MKQGDMAWFKKQPSPRFSYTAGHGWAAECWVEFTGKSGQVVWAGTFPGWIADSFSGAVRELRREIRIKRRHYAGGGE